VFCRQGLAALKLEPDVTYRWKFSACEIKVQNGSMLEILSQIISRHSLEVSILVASLIQHLSKIPEVSFNPLSVVLIGVVAMFLASVVGP
jgi:hypothetical protein